MIIYVDMDGVLCDFERRAAEVSGKKFSEMSRQDIWKAISEDPEFYLNLPWVESGRLLWKFLCEEDFDPWILSASSSHVVKSTHHKYIWNKRELGLGVERIVVVPHKTDKAFFAMNDGKPNFLIDDNEKNIAEWNAAGGIGFLYQNNNKALFEALLIAICKGK